MGLCLNVTTLFHKDTQLLLPTPFCINTMCQFAQASGNVCNLENSEILEEIFRYLDQLSST